MFTIWQYKKILSSWILHKQKRSREKIQPFIISFFREDMNDLKIVPAAEVWNVPNGRWVRVAGLVLVRQRPGTASGFSFTKTSRLFGNVGSVPSSGRPACEG